MSVNNIRPDPFEQLGKLPFHLSGPEVCDLKRLLFDESEYTIQQGPPRREVYYVDLRADLLQWLQPCEFSPALNKREQRKFMVLRELSHEIPDL
jgi:hypothetical protein